MALSAPVDYNNLDANPAQGVFLTAKEFQLLLDGGAGNGKTLAGCFKGIQCMLNIPGSVGLVGGYEMPELRKSTMLDFIEILRDMIDWKSEVAKFNDQQGILTLKNGSTVSFQGLNIPPSEYSKIKNFNLGWVFIDQLEHISEQVYLRLLLRLRHPLGPRQIWSTANPEGHIWVWRTFIKRKQKIYEDKNMVVNKGQDTLRVGASTYVNRKNLPDEYIDRIKRSYPGYLADRYIMGSWDSFEGQIWPTFDDDIHVVPDHEPPPGFKRFVAIDHGLSAPTCGLFFYVGAGETVKNEPFTYVVVFQEYWKISHLVQYHKVNLLRLAKDLDLYDYWKLDPACWAKTRERAGEPWSIADEFAEDPYSIPISQANNNWDSSVARVAQYMEVNPEYINPFTGKIGSPTLFICESCENLIDTIPGYVFDEAATERGEDKPMSTTIRHAVDSLRYGIMSRPDPTREEKPKVPVGSPAYYRMKMKQARRMGGTDGWRRYYVDSILS